jgi:tRNA-Thr(GGU) m(6)t(6)A37 methyltransferase TsaA
MANFWRDISLMTARNKNVRRGTRAKEKQSDGLRPIGVIRSTLKERSKAPKQASEGAPDVWLEVHPFAAPALDGLAVGDEVIILTWLHRAHREVLKVHPRSDPSRRLTGVFATRSPDRPNPIGLHQVTVRKISTRRLRIGPMEAIDGTPVIDIKPVLCQVQKN